jgi:hypothetical protein
MRIYYKSQYKFEEEEEEDIFRTICGSFLTCKNTSILNRANTYDFLTQGEVFIS